MAEQTVQVKIYAPFKTYFEGPAGSISAVNDTGPFDILARHKNFICLLKPGEIKVRQKDRPDFVMPVSRGVMHVRSDKVTVFLDV
ncbi:hypothetical protein HYW36_00515 [Candidatus Saccharibacteria bacterium]|nr:hypothetical protein [Candidatus Saccharibacteria bacterium]